MHRPVLAALLAALAFALVGAQSALASARHHHHHHHGHGRNVVFVQTNQPGGNAVVVYDRAHDGTLAWAGEYPTGGVGGTAAPGTESDRLATQGSLAYDARQRVLIAVNAGSDTVSAFRVHGDRLRLVDVVPSGGDFPASVAIDGSLVYVLNSGGSGTVSGFRLFHGALIPLPGSARSLGLANGSPPNFLTAPGQVGFSPDGRQLLVTTKASTSSIDVFKVRPDGRLSASPVVNPSATPVPFAFSFDPSGQLVAGEAGASSVTTYRLRPDGTLTGPQSASDGQTALCWIQRVGPYYFVSNTGSNTLSSFRLTRSGQPVLLNAVAASTPAGPIDLAASDRFLYAETGLAGTVEEYAVQADGSLVSIGSVTGLPAGIEGIAAS
jgi:6-phosphogluconolactonase (cycloisomerase 2 family)